jgi:hypothetical protein
MVVTPQPQILARRRHIWGKDSLRAHRPADASVMGHARTEWLADAPPRRRSGAILAAGVFTVAYLLAAAAAAMTSGNGEFVFYILVMLVLAAVIGFVHLRVTLTAALIWALAIWGALHMAGGLVPLPEGWPVNGEVHVLYSWWIIPRAGGGGWLKYDHVVHAYGFAVTTWLCWEGLLAAIRGCGGAARPTFGLLTLCVAAGCGFGAMNEIVEFIATMIAATNVGGYENTGWDLVANLVGSCLAACVIAIRRRR